MSDYRMHRKFVRGSVGAGVEQDAIIDSSGNVVSFALDTHTHPDPTFPVTDDDLTPLEDDIETLQNKTIDLSDYVTPGYGVPAEDAGVALTAVRNPAASDYDDVTYAKSDVVPLGVTSSIVIRIPNANNVNSYIVQRTRADGTVLDTWQGTSFRYSAVNGVAHRFYTLGTTNNPARFSFANTDRIRIRAYTTTKHSLYTGATVLPAIDTHATPQTGELRRTATNNGVEIYNGTDWVAIEAADLTAEQEITKINTASSGTINKERVEQRTGDETIGSINSGSGTINAARLSYDDTLVTTEVYNRTLTNLQNQRWFSTSWAIPEDGLFFLQFGTTDSLGAAIADGISEVFSAAQLRSKLSIDIASEPTVLDNRAIKIGEGVPVEHNATTNVYLARTIANTLLIWTVSGDASSARPSPLRVHEISGGGTSDNVGDKRVYRSTLAVNAANTWVEVPWQVPVRGVFRLVFGATGTSPDGIGKVFSAEVLRGRGGTVTPGQTSLEHGIKVLDDNPSGSVLLVDASAGITAAGRLALSFSDADGDPSPLTIYQMTTQDDPNYIRSNTGTGLHTRGTVGTFTNPRFLGEFSNYRGATHRTTGRDQALLGGGAFNLSDYSWLLFEHRRVSPYTNGQWTMTRGNLTSIRAHTVALGQALLSTQDLDTQARASATTYRAGATLTVSFTAQGGLTVIPAPLDAFTVPAPGAYQAGYRLNLLSSTAGGDSVDHFHVWDWLDDSSPYYQAITCVYGIE